MATNRPLRIFLCHSSHDKPAVRELYQQLRAEAWIQPWLDEEELFPGQDWNLEIEKAVEASDAILVCLTKGSINKEGYVQRELRSVLDLADYKPEGTLFIIPVRLEECEPPRRLRTWQYADYFAGSRDRAFQRLLVSLKRRADALDLQFESPSSPPEKKTIVESPIIDENAPKPTLKVENRHEDKSVIVETIDPKRHLDDLAPTEEEQSDQKKQVAGAMPAPKNEQIPAQPKPKLEKSDFDESRHPTKEWIEANKLTLSNGMEFLLVPAGKFLMGSQPDDKQAHDDEKPQHTVDIPYDYWMARFTVTNELYSVYARAQGILHPVDGWENKKDHPVTYVKWTDAMGYCQWLNGLIESELPSGLILRLPTDAEWVKAARGTDGRIYPWGNQFYKFNCNTEEGRKGKTTPVEAYSPRGDSPFGCADMSGNVWEWTHSLKKAYPYNVKDGREDEKASGTRVRHGGSFEFDKWGARCASRLGDTVGNFHNCFGFRVVMAPPNLS